LFGVNVISGTLAPGAGAVVVVVVVVVVVIVSVTVVIVVPVVTVDSVTGGDITELVATGDTVCVWAQSANASSFGAGTPGCTRSLQLSREVSSTPSIPYAVAAT